MRMTDNENAVMELLKMQEHFRTIEGLTMEEKEDILCKINLSLEKIQWEMMWKVLDVVTEKTIDWETLSDLMDRKEYVLHSKDLKWRSQLQADVLNEINPKINELTKNNEA